MPAPLNEPTQQHQFPTVPSDLLTVPEAAAAIRLTEATLRNWMKLGIVPVYRLANGRDLRLSLATLVSVVPPKVPAARHWVGTDGQRRLRIDPRPRYEHRTKQRGTSVEQAEP